MSAGQAPSADRHAHDMARVVFVCEHGSAKSMIAASHFNRLAAERALAVRAVSRGTVPDDVVPALVREGLRADGVEIGAVTPQALDVADARGAALFVAFDVDVPAATAGRVPVRRWDGMPSVLADYAVARGAITAHVAQLVVELAGASPAADGRA